MINSEVIDNGTDVHSKSTTQWVKWIIIGIALLLVFLQWSFDTVDREQLIYEVPKWAQFDLLESHWTYFYLHLFTIVPVFLLSFDKNVHFYKKWKYLLPPTLIVGAIFIAWDVVFTAREVWGFNHDYLSGIFLMGLPLEEILFFVTVPYACVFVYECLNFYIKPDLIKPFEQGISLALIVLFMSIGLWKFWNMYTSTTFLLAGLFLLYHLLFLDGTYRGRFYLAFFVIWAPFLLVNGVLTGGFTEAPIVIYNPAEFFGVRIGSVPIDDSVYNFLMLFAIVTGFEYLRKKPKML